MATKTKILLVEDDASMGYLFKDYLEMTGFEVHLLTEGGAAMSVFIKEKFHICILDVMLPQKCLFRAFAAPEYPEYRS